jgi:tRNA pseudouridine38-40 synthase
MGKTDYGPGTIREGAEGIGIPANVTRRLRLDLAFVGTGVSGWQAQKDGSTLQDFLDDALKNIGHNGRRVVGCSRTDAGVHARAFTAHVDTDLDRPSQPLLFGLNAHLPAAVRIYRAGWVRDDFHARYSCTGKTYRYNIYRDSVVPPFLAPYVLRWKGTLDSEIMGLTSRTFLGEHDFALFTTAYGRTRNTVRTVTQCRVEERGPLLVLTVSGPSFLHRMVRLIGGALVAVGAGRLEPGQIPAMLSGHLPGCQVPALPAGGLALWAIAYPPDAEPKEAFGHLPEETSFPLFF